MPILNSFDAFYLTKQQYDVNDIKKMMLLTLPIASSHIYSSFRTMEIYDQFVNFFGRNCKRILELLEISINLDKFVLTANNNLYQLFYNLISTSDYKKSKSAYIKNDFDSFNIIISNSNINIYVSGISYAICCIHDSLLSEEYDEFLIYQFISYLLAASGHTLVACAEIFSDDYFLSFYQLNLFSEIHLFLETYSNYSIKKLENIKNTYFYIYISDLNEYHHVKHNTQINNPYVQIFHINERLHHVFSFLPINNIFVESKEEFSQWDKFKINKIAVSLYNYQIYESESEKDWKISKIEEFNKTFINASDFLENFGKKIKCYNTLQDQNPSYYIDFNEMHFVKIGHHVKDPLKLLAIDTEIYDMMHDVSFLLQYSTPLTNRLKSKRSKTGKYILEKLLYAFHKIYKHYNIWAYRSQIYTVINAINYVDLVIDKNHKGCIYQVKTGEGKSIIILALAEIFARMGKTIHIVTSNIVLACRDYEKSLQYFKECNFKTGILLHRGEFEHIQCSDKNKYYPSSAESDFYHDSWFDNPSNMNIKICDKSKFSKTCNIVFSTFFNFEGWYLRQCEEHPTQMEEYFNDCYLIIDESDTILIDEITNGTIVSREMKSKALDILENVYEWHLLKKSETFILDKIKNMWPECNDINLNDIISMKKDVDFALSFEEGKKYILEKDKDNYYNIFPFDNEHKGIAEREKEFNGFIHQFIGFKEKRANPDKKIKIRPLSLNYMFISHPIFVNLYKGVWGFTGTVGSQKDREILRKYYKLDTVEIPQHCTNFRKDLPSVICKDITERNEKIIEEIQLFHEKENPVLVIFENINEIEDLRLLIIQKIKDAKILTFNGTNMDKSIIENESGHKGMVTLGTNFCGRGTDILYDEQYPLHVIISYGPRNKRALDQAYGRTGRNGKPGTTRIICTKKDYYKTTRMPNDNLINKILNEYNLKKTRQAYFIEEFRKNRPWIFNSNAGQYNLFSEYEKCILRDSTLNINRITAFNYEFPLCMSINTFISIQLQKIYSIKNCPECKYSWFLFQRYLRELILESWSLFNDKFTKDFEIEKEKNKAKARDFNFYKEFFDKRFLELEEKLSKYLPNEIDKTMTQTFRRIFTNLEIKWEKIIMSYFPKTICDFQKKSDPNSLFSFKTGFYPFELKDKSGARICFIQDSDDSQSINFIQDPELLYDARFSITYIIDKIFEKICLAIDDQLSAILGLHFYIRRTFAGCEFGVCVDPLFDDIIINENHCLFDVKPIMLFAICCKSLKPVLAGILIIVLVFVTIVAGKIAKYFATPQASIIDIIKTLGEKLYTTVKSKCKDIVISAIQDISIVRKVLAKIINWLKRQIINQLSNQDDSIAIIMKIVLAMFSSSELNNIGGKVNDSIISKIRINKKVRNLFAEMSPIVDLIKIAILFILLISAFVKNFKAKRALNKSASSYQNELIKKEKRKNSYFHNYNDDDLDDFNSYQDIKKDVQNNTTFRNEISKEASDDND